MKKLFLTPLLILFVSISVQAAETDPTDASGGGADAADATQERLKLCAGCHGMDGNSQFATFPKLAGQHAPYLLKQLKDFKANKDRSNPIMLGQVAALTEKDMQELADYFASQETAPGTVHTDKETLAFGKRIYHGGNMDTGVPACMACHGPAGTGNDLAGFPALAGQHATYTRTQLNSFHSGERKNDKKSMMRGAASRLTGEEIEAVSQYIASLK
uniref:Cytochrome c553 n=1 Tax=Candidatus Kentrum sp. DK TaxID=2126562 RepID=A0A450SBR5_9GAMM|nr:MAG: Cytochrome c553 [Candidatus Kentron sp. DK]VFJ49650.1 MAG: Cytochrome c553 [Candidatus Kentron sp. DK]